MGKNLGVLILSAAAMTVAFSGQADAARYQVLVLSDDLFNQEIVQAVIEPEAAPDPEAEPEAVPDAEPEAAPDESSSGGGNGSSNCKNNGHGNNVDGMDSSNPGKKKGEDASGDVDDEAP